MMSPSRFNPAICETDRVQIECSHSFGIGAGRTASGGRIGHLARRCVQSCAFRPGFPRIANDATGVRTDELAIDGLLFSKMQVVVFDKLRSIVRIGGRILLFLC